jgi:hypothetical protein
MGFAALNPSYGLSVIPAERSESRNPDSATVRVSVAQHRLSGILRRRLTIIESMTILGSGSRRLCRLGRNDDRAPLHPIVSDSNYD